MMKQTVVVGTLSALAHETRLQVYRLLEKEGNVGVAAGEIASRLGLAPTALSNHLAILTRAGIVSQERKGRSIIYRALPDQVRALAKVLVDG